MRTCTAGLYTRTRCEIPNDRCDEEGTMVAIISGWVTGRGKPRSWVASYPERVLQSMAIPFEGVERL